MAQVEVEEPPASPRQAPQPQAPAPGPRGPGAESQASGPGEESRTAAPRRQVPRRLRLAAIAGVAVLVVAGVLYGLHARQYEDTDDAQVDGHVHPLSARINGTVQWVNPQAEENRHVAAGTVLVNVDPADFQAAAAGAQAE